MQIPAGTSPLDLLCLFGCQRRDQCNDGQSILDFGMCPKLTNRIYTIAFLHLQVDQNHISRCGFYAFYAEQSRALAAERASQP